MIKRMKIRQGDNQKRGTQASALAVALLWLMLGQVSLATPPAVPNPQSAIRNPQSSRLVVRVKPTAEIESEVITLGAVAAIEGDAEQCQRAGTITLGYAPEVGVPRVIRREAITLALAAADLAPESVRLEAPAELIVYRAAQKIEAERITEAVRRALAEGAEFQSGVTRLQRLDLPGEVSVAAGKAELRVTYNKQQNLLAPFTVIVEIAVDGRAVKRLPLTAQLEVHARIAVAARALAANERLNPEADVRFEVRRLAGRLSDYLTDVRSLRGKSLRRPAAAGEQLMAEMFFNDILVRRGDEVRIVAEGARVAVTTRGEAQAAGRLGERIQVKNLQTKALLQAEVIDEGVVKVRF